MLQVRRGEFETNSSSSHSIIIEKKAHLLEEKIDPGWHIWDETEMRCRGTIGLRTVSEVAFQGGGRGIAWAMSQN